MATKAFDYALAEVDLVRKAVNALRGLASNTSTRQHAIRDLQILEAVLRGVQDVSIESASEKTLRNLHYCSHFCRPPLNQFLRSLKELETDLCHALARGESLAQTSREPVWATKLEREVALLQSSVGTGLRVIDLLLRVEAMRCDLATNTTLPGDLQRIIETFQEHLHGPGKRHIGPGHHYNNIKNSGGYSHYGDKYFFNGAPPIALVEAVAKKLDGTAGLLQIDQAVPIGNHLMGMSPQGVALNLVVNDNTLGPCTTMPANVQPLTPQTTDLSAIELTKLLLQCLLDSSLTKLNALLAMLLWTIPDFRTFVRSLTAITRLPSMLLDDNITLVDALNREVSLPYQWFRKWPHMLAHLQYEFKGTPGEYHISNNLFKMFRESKGSNIAAAISTEQWEDVVSPGIRISMLVLIEQRRGPVYCPFCRRLRGEDWHRAGWHLCTHCGSSALRVPIRPLDRPLPKGLNARNLLRTRESYRFCVTQEQIRRLNRVPSRRADTLQNRTVVRHIIRNSDLKPQVWQARGRIPVVTNTTASSRVAQQNPADRLAFHSIRTQMLSLRNGLLRSSMLFELGDISKK